MCDLARLRGFDVVSTAPLSAYQQAVEPAYRLPDLGRDDALLVCVGNTRRLWPLFLEAARAEERLRGRDHPLDRWVERQLRAVAASTGVRHAIRFAHDPEPRRVAMQQLARVTGLAALSPSYLSVHPRFGPWIGLRAAIVFDADPPAPVDPRLEPCASCVGRPCVPALERALGEAAALDDAEIATGWRRWLAVRDACPVGREHRYGDAQIRYHYTKDREILT